MSEPWSALIDITLFGRWLHIVSSIVWIVWLVSLCRATSLRAGRIAAGRQAWWSVLVLATGVLMLSMQVETMSARLFPAIVAAVFMFLNAWLVIWPQKRLLLVAEKQLVAGGESLPEADAALVKCRRVAAVNLMLVVPVSFFMTAGAHHSVALAADPAWLLLLLTALALFCLMESAVWLTRQVLPLWTALMLGTTATAMLWSLFVFWPQT
ncbi:MAG: hypothetical protein KDI36_11515 [Pseudomonadales bacterium]|nr:hypothetical protein [Pseudomonadales bacterium]